MQHPQHNGRARAVEISAPAKCQLCGKVLVGPIAALGGVLAPGVPVGPRFIHFMETLFRHAQEEHPQHWAAAQAKGAEMTGWFLLSLYQTSDPAVTRQRDLYRWLTKQSTMKATAENLDIEARNVAREFMEDLDADDLATENKEITTAILAEKIETSLKTLREILEEPDLFTRQDIEETQKKASRIIQA